MNPAKAKGKMDIHHPPHSLSLFLNSLPFSKEKKPWESWQVAKGGVVSSKSESQAAAVFCGGWQNSATYANSEGTFSGGGRCLQSFI